MRGPAFSRLGERLCGQSTGFGDSNKGSLISNI